MLARLFPEVRAVERQRFTAFFFLAALLLAGQAVGGTAAESLLLSRLGVQALPVAMVAASLTTIAGSALYSRWVGRRRHEVSFLLMLTLGMSFLSLTIPLVQARIEAVYIALFCFNWLTFTLYYNHFFTLVGDYFDTLAMKRLVPLFVVGATSGEIAGGLSASWMSANLGAQGLLLLWIGWQGLAATFLWLLQTKLLSWNPAAHNRGSSRPTTAAPSGWTYLRRSSLGQSLALMAAAMMVTNTVVQYLHADIFVQTFSGEGQLASFLGLFTATTNMIELVIGARITPWLVRRYGVAQTNMIQPIGAVLTMVALSGSYTLLPAMLAWMNRKMLNDSLAAPTRAMLYSAFPARFRGPVRASVDGVFGAGSQALAGLALSMLQHFVAVADLVWVGIAVACGYVAAAWRVRSVYMATLVGDLALSRLHLPACQQHPRRTTPLLGEGEDGLLLGGPEELGRWAEKPDEPRSLLALARLQTLTDPLATVVIARFLEDPRPAIRLAASKGLGHRGEPALSHIEPYFRTAAIASVQAAYDAVANTECERGRAMLAQEIRLLVREAWRHLFLAETAARFQEPLLRLALEDHCSRCQGLAFKVLSLLEGEQLMAPVMNTLRFANAAARANAMEVLSNLGDREAAGLLVLLTESTSRADKLASAARIMPALSKISSPNDSAQAECATRSASVRAGLLESCSYSSSPFVRRAVARSGHPDSDQALERLTRLKAYDLFEPLGLEELQGVSEYLVTERFGAGEVVVAEGEEGERLYLAVEGRLHPPVTTFGVTALLDGGPQRYTVTAQGRCTFWSLRREHFHLLIRRYPEIGLALFRRLARQLKRQEVQLKSLPE